MTDFLNYILKYDNDNKDMYNFIHSCLIHGDLYAFGGCMENKKFKDFLEHVL